MTTISLRTAMDSMSGYGNDGIGLAKALLEHGGYDVHLFPYGILPPIPPEVALLLTKQYRNQYDFGLIHTYPGALEIPGGMRRACDSVWGWTMWEFETYEGEEEATLAKRMENFEGILSYDYVTQTALAPYAANDDQLRVLQGGYDSSELRYVEQREWFDVPFRFCMVGALHNRKQPFLAINAFNELKKEHGDDFNAELHLKNNMKTLHPKMMDVYPGLHIYYELWTRAQMLNFYAHCHCLLAPSIGEGKNLPALEAATTGMAVAATDFGGHRMWMNDQWAYPMTWEPTHMDGSGWGAQVSLETMKKTMWHIYTHREEAREKGYLASQTLPSMCDWKRVVERLRDFLR